MTGLLVTAAVGVLAACAGGSDEPEAAPPPLIVPEGLAQPQIVGGTPAAGGAYPFAAYIQTRLDENGDGVAEPGVGLCGGSLIGARWVLTAAHCMPGALESRVWIGAERAGVGDPYRASAAEGDLWSHPEFDGQTMENDVALIRLDRPAPQRAVSLVLADDDALWQPGTTATIIGWGRTAEAGSLSADLLQAQVPVLTDEDCARLPGFDSATMVCAGGGTVDTCQGDSGGPILVRYGERNWFQFGVVSWGIGCAQPGRPGVYSRLETLAPSVVSQLEGDSEVPVSAASAETGEATPARDGATVQGTVQTGGLATLVYFQLRPADVEEYTQSGTAYAGAGTASNRWRAVFRGLEPGTEYAYRVAVWSASGGLRAADEKTFTTLP